MSRAMGRVMSLMAVTRYRPAADDRPRHIRRLSSPTPTSCWRNNARLRRGLRRRATWRCARGASWPSWPAWTAAWTSSRCSAWATARRTSSATPAAWSPTTSSVRWCCRQRSLGTREIILIHHTNCGLQAVSEDEFKAELEAEVGHQAVVGARGLHRPVRRRPPEHQPAAAQPVREVQGPHPRLRLRRRRRPTARSHSDASGTGLRAPGLRGMLPRTFGLTGSSTITRGRAAPRHPRRLMSRMRTLMSSTMRRHDRLVRPAGHGLTRLLDLLADADGGRQIAEPLGRGSLAFNHQSSSWSAASTLDWACPAPGRSANSPRAMPSSDLLLDGSSPNVRMFIARTPLKITATRSSSATWSRSASSPASPAVPVGLASMPVVRAAELVGLHARASSWATTGEPCAVGHRADAPAASRRSRRRGCRRPPSRPTCSHGHMHVGPVLGGVRRAAHRRTRVPTPGRAARSRRSARRGGGA